MLFLWFAWNEISNCLNNVIAPINKDKELLIYITKSFLKVLKSSFKHRNDSIISKRHFISNSVNYEENSRNLWIKPNQNIVKLFHCESGE